MNIRTYGFSMATPRRPRFSPSSSGRQGGRNRLSQAQTAQSLLLAQQEAITALLTRGPAGRKAPTTAGRDDCEVDMSTSDFRSWRRSVEDWITLNSVKDEDAVCYIRGSVVKGPGLCLAVMASMGSNPIRGRSPLGFFR